MALMNLNIDGVLTVEKVVVPADGITVLGHSLFRGERIIVTHNGVRATRGQDFIPDRIDERLYYQKNICLFTAVKILDENLLNEEIEVEYYACGDYINAEIWNEYPSSASLKQSLASKVDNSDFTKEVKRIDSDINAEVIARTDADNALQDNINIETNLRIAEDEKLQTNINNEATTRTNADNTLQNNINAEEVNRQSADAEIRNELSNETNLRLAGDAVLQEKIDAEMSTRAENDSSLQTQISDLKTKFESFVPGLTYKVVSALPTADILNDVIYFVPADSTGSQSVYDEYIYIDGDWELIGTTATTQAITVDSALSATSTNPVQNKVIHEALKNKKSVYVRLEELGLDASATLNDAIGAMPYRSIALFNATIFEDYQNIFPYTETADQYSGVCIVKGDNISRIYVVWFREEGKKAAFAKMNSKNQIEGWERITLNPRESNVYKTYGGINELNAAKGTSITLKTNEDNTQTIIDALNSGEEFVEWYNNSNNRFGIALDTFGTRINCLRITKMSATNGYVFAMMNSGVVLNRVYANGVLGQWINTINSYSQEITGYTVKNSSYYKDPGVVMNLWKKNGIAFINLQVQCVSPSYSNRIFITGLPPSAISLHFEVQLNNDSNKLHVSIDTSGNLSLSDGTQNNIYRVAFSYPIDD